jgi:hypothetical protein
MGALDIPARELDRRKNSFSPEQKAALDAPEVWPEVDALLVKIQQLTKTNERMRELVMQLSVLVIRNVFDRESQPAPVDMIARTRP